MTKYEEIIEMINKFAGYVQTSQVVEAGISKTYFKEVIEKEGLEKVANGVYVAQDTLIDDLYVNCLVSKNIIYSNETALYLHGLMEKEPNSVNITVPRNYNANNFRKKGYKIFTVSDELLKLGEMNIKTNFGNEVRVYDIDRTICDIIKMKEKMDIQVFQTAIKEYMLNQSKNLNNLIIYSQKMNIEKKVRLYIEVLLWLKQLDN